MLPLISTVLFLLQAVISVRTELVAVPATVTDARGHSVNGLTAENFRVYDEGRLQSITVFHHGFKACFAVCPSSRYCKPSATPHASRPDDEDGGDNASRRTYAEVLALARQSDAVIYAIGLLGTAPAEEEEDAGLLKRLCKDTGGVAYFPRTPAEIAAVSAQVARDLREQYALGFVPTTRTDGGAFRKIAVRVSAPGHGRLHVRTRAGYVGGRETP